MSGVTDTAMKSFKNTYSDLLESSAGALSSSGRAYNDNTAVTNLSLGLADKRAGYEMSLPSAQEAITQQRQTQMNLEANAQYQDWLKSLPEYNPNLDRAMTYLNDQTSSGTTILSGLYSGQTAALWGILGTAVGAFTAGSGNKGGNTGTSSGTATK
jgi:hypothetical protein